MKHLNRWAHQALAASVIVLLFTGMVSPAESDADQTLGCACVGRVGNVDCDYTDAVTLSDLNFLIDHLYINLPPLPNPQEANCDGDPAGLITMGDLTALIDHLFISLSPLPWCPGHLNHPPETRIDELPEASFIDGPPSDNETPGVRLHWSGSDRTDNPYDSVVSAYRWKLFGPYDDSTYQHLTSEFQVRVFQMADGTMYRYGQSEPAIFVVCDTSYVHGQQAIACDTTLVDTIAASSQYGTVDTILDVESSEFLSHYPAFNRVVDSSYDGDSSVWTAATRDTFYNVFANYPSDTTTEQHFVFWVTAQDKDDPSVEDPTPAWSGFTVIEPRHERPVLVIDFQRGARTNGPTRATIKNYWFRAVSNWLVSRPDIPPVFDSARDYTTIVKLLNSPELMREFPRLLLQYKAVILSSDEVLPGEWGNQSGQPEQHIYRAVAAGTQSWVAMRVPIGTYGAVSPEDTAETNWQYKSVWGVDRIRFSAWCRNAVLDSTRIEDFIGALPVDSTVWPALIVDSALLHQRYYWPSAINIAWDPSLAALPEVDYLDVTPDAEVLYTYTSLYGAQHPMGPEYSFQDRPVMVRVDRGYFRTVHSLFTPMAFAEPEAQTLVNKVLDWLVDAPVPARSVSGGK